VTATSTTEVVRMPRRVQFRGSGRQTGEGA